MRPCILALSCLVVWLHGCSTGPRRTASRQAQDSSTGAGPSGQARPTVAVVPNLIDMPSARASEILGELGLGSDWGRPVTVRCEARPRTVVRQQPAAGDILSTSMTVRIRTASLDLRSFRGPCDPSDPPPGSTSGADMELARQFYRFAADPSLGAPFAGEGVWVGIEDGPPSTTLTGNRIGELSAWEMGSGYAEQSGPFSALDTLAQSAGYYELRDGVTGTCPQRQGIGPPEMRGFRAISLTSPRDVTSACSEWWGVTLFLDARGHIRGVSLRLGSP